MIASAIQKIIDVTTPDKVSVGRKFYWPGAATPFDEAKPHIKSLNFHSLDALAKMIRNDSLPEGKLFIEVVNATTVRVFTNLDEELEREIVCTAEASTPGFSEGYREYEKFVIELRSRFIPNEGSNYLLDLLSRIDINENSVSEDNGVTQQVVVRKGIALKDTAVVKPIVSLKPYRSFMEVDQPEGEFLVRVDRAGCIGLFEADGGMWQQQAKANIGKWFDLMLHDEIDAGRVVVMM